jgi:hypothetical protein
MVVGRSRKPSPVEFGSIVDTPWSEEGVFFNSVSHPLHKHLGIDKKLISENSLRGRY